MPNLLESMFVLPKIRVFRVLIPKYCYVNLMLSHDLSQNLGANRCPSLVSVALPHIAMKEVP